MFGLVLGIALLRGDPAREGLAVVVKDLPLKARHSAFDFDPMPVTLLAIASSLMLVKDNTGRVKRPSQRPPVNPVHEIGPISRYLIARLDARNLRDKVVGQFVVGVER